MEVDRERSTEDFAGRSGLDEIQDKNETMDLLLLLPPEILEMVFDYLDAPALVNLRLTSKATKAFVEQEKYLEKIPVYMKPKPTHSVLRQVNVSSIPWTNFNFDVDLISTTCFPTFASKYASTMKVCCLYGQPRLRSMPTQDQQSIRRFLSKLTSLHTLEIRNVPLTWAFYGPYYIKQARNDNNKMNENLERVRTFHISLDFEHYHLGDLEYLQFLQHSSNLRIVELKHNPQPPVGRYPSLNAMPISHSLFQPLLEFMESRSPDGDESEDDGSQHLLNSGPLDIYFQGMERVELARNKFIQCRGIFLEIVEKCHGTTVKLHNVPCYLLPLDRPDLSDVQRLKYDSCIVSLSGELAEFRQGRNIYVPAKFLEDQ